MEEKIDIILSVEDKSESEVRKREVEVKKLHPVEYKESI